MLNFLLPIWKKSKDVNLQPENILVFKEDALPPILEVSSSPICSLGFYILSHLQLKILVLKIVQQFFSELKFEE